MGRLNLIIFGGFRARIGGRDVPFPTKKAQALLAYLAVRPGHPHLRDKLAALLWGSAGKQEARHSLRQTMTSLRWVLSTLSPPHLVTDGESVTLACSSMDIDVVTFERLASRDTPRALTRAAALYRGDLLDGLDVSEEPFEEWLSGERTRLREAAMDVFTRLVDHQAKSGTLKSAIQSAMRLLTLDPLREDFHRTLMQLYARQGRLGDAVRQYQCCGRVLQRELGVEPTDETRQLLYEILPQWPPPGMRPDPGAPRESAHEPETADTVGSGGPSYAEWSELTALRDAIHEAIAMFRAIEARFWLVNTEADMTPKKVSFE